MFKDLPAIDLNDSPEAPSTTAPLATSPRMPPGRRRLRGRQTRSRSRQESSHDRCLLGAAARHRRPVDTAGQVALDPTGALVGPGDIGAQARQVFDNLQATLQAVGPGFDQYVNVEQPPASTAVEVRWLVRDDLHIEVEAIAVVASVQPMTATA